MAEKRLTFEQALEKLEQIVKNMESGELSLEELLKHFEEGVGLVKTCHKKLNEAEQKVEVLISGLADEKEEGESLERRENSGF